MGDPVRFTELRDLVQRAEELASKLGAATPQSTDAAAVVGQMVTGAMSLVDQRIADFEQRFVAHEQRMSVLALELRASIPQMPDFGPLVIALQANADRERADSPALDFSPLITGLAEVAKGQREICARMDKPVVREGLAELPSGPVKLRITETRSK